jgi:hypothetical protein
MKNCRGGCGNALSGMRIRGEKEPRSSGQKPTKTMAEPGMADDM